MASSRTVSYTHLDVYKRQILAPAVTHGWVAAVAYHAENRAKELADQVDYKLYTSSNAEEDVYKRQAQQDSKGTGYRS